MELDYCCMVETTITALTFLVKRMCNEGWEPQGGIAVDTTMSGSTTFYYQAMIRREPQK